MEKNFPWGLSLALLVSVIVLGMLSLRQFYVLRQLEKKYAFSDKTHDRQEKYIVNHLMQLHHLFDDELNQNRTEQQQSAEADFSEISKSVCLIQGEYTFMDPVTQKPLRHMSQLTQHEPARERTTAISNESEPAGALSINGAGEPLSIHYTGSGFLVEQSGYILTNYHVVEPWQTDGHYQHVVAAGYQPEHLLLRAFFPGYPEPFNLAVRDTAPAYDLALLECEMDNVSIPALECLDPTERIKVGHTIYVIGYPTGFDLLLARLPDHQLLEVMGHEFVSYDRLGENIARLGLIQPVATQGICGKYQDDRFIYDAQTTIGGSGAPVVNRRGQVIAINTALMKGFSGTNFGTPIKYGLEILEKTEGR